MKDSSKISPQKEKPPNFKEMLEAAEKIDISPNVLPSNAKTNTMLTKPPPIPIPNLTLQVAPPVFSKTISERPVRPIGKSNSFSETFDEQQMNAKRQAANIDMEIGEDEVFEINTNKRKILNANRQNKQNIATKTNENRNKNAKDMEKQIERERAKEVKQASDKVYNQTEDCSINDISITLKDMNNRMALEKQARVQEKEGFAEIVKSLLGSHLEPIKADLRKISDTQTEHEEKIDLNTKARIRFEKSEKELETMGNTLNICSDFVFEHKETIPKVKEDVTNIDKRLEKVEAMIANGVFTGMAASANAQTGNGTYNPDTWNEHLTQLNNDAKLNLMIFTREIKAKTKNEAESIVKSINAEIEKVSRDHFGEDLTVPQREVSRTMKPNALKVKCDNLDEKFRYQDLINKRVRSMRVKADREIPGPYITKYSQFNTIAFNIRKTKEYSARISIRENWMYLESRKKSNDPNIEYEWEIVEDNQFYPPVPGTKEHSKAIQQKMRNNSSSLRKETLSNTGDLEKLKRTIIVDTTPVNIIPEIPKEQKEAFLTYLNNLVTAEHPGIIIECANVWKENTLEIQCKDIQGANKMANTIQSKPIVWESSDNGNVHLECSLLGWIKTRNRQNSFFSKT